MAATDQHTSKGVPSVVAVIPTHRRPHLLAEALGSVLAQSTPPDEIVIATDVDGDAATERVVAELAPSARLVVGGARGASASRNAGYRAASSDVVAFLDDDDRWDVRHVEVALEAIAEVDAVVVAARQFDDTWVGPTRVVPPGLQRDDVVVINPGVTGSNLVVRRRALDTLGGFDESLWVSNDKDLFVRFLDAGFEYRSVSAAVVDRRRSADGRLTTTSASRVAGLRAYLEKHEAGLSGRQRRLLRAQIARVSARHAPGRFRSTFRRATALVLVGPRGIRALRNDQRPIRGRRSRD